MYRPSSYSRGREALLLVLSDVACKDWGASVRFLVMAKFCVTLAMWSLQLIWHVVHLVDVEVSLRSLYVNAS